MNPTGLGSGARVLNAYPAGARPGRIRGLAGGGVSQPAHPDPDPQQPSQGMQRYAAASWSGDISSDLDGDAQADCGRARVRNLGDAVLDVRHRRVLGAPSASRHSSRAGRAALEEWRELVTRWFQFATFVPLLRVHGQAPQARDVGVRRRRQPTSLQGAAEVRSPALPACCHVGILSWAPASRAGDATIMRPLVMDFREDPEVLGIGDQFLFGPSLLVNPVTSPGATRAVRVPAARSRLVRLLDRRARRRAGRRHRRARALRIAAPST